MRATKGPECLASARKIAGSAFTIIAAFSSPRNPFGRQHEGPNLRIEQRTQLQRVIADAIVLSEHHPATRANIGQPFLVARVLPQVVVVDFYARAIRPKRLGDGLSS